MINRNYIVTILSTSAALLLSLPASASELLPQQHYADELQRCAAAICAELLVDSDIRLQHQVTNISKGNIWYEFAIESSPAGATQLASLR